MLLRLPRYVHQHAASPGEPVIIVVRVVVRTFDIVRLRRSMRKFIGARATYPF